MSMLLVVAAIVAVSAVSAFTLATCAFVGGRSAPEELTEQPLQWHAAGEVQGSMLDSAGAHRA